MIFKLKNYVFSAKLFPRPVGSLIASVMALAGGVSHRVPGCVFKGIFGCVLETRIWAPSPVGTLIARRSRCVATFGCSS